MRALNSAMYAPGWLNSFTNSVTLDRVNCNFNFPVPLILCALDFRCEIILSDLNAEDHKS